MCRSGASCGCGGSQSSAVPVLAAAGAAASSGVLAAVIGDVLMAVIAVLAVTLAGGAAYLVHVLRREAGQVHLGPLALPVAQLRHQAEIASRPVPALGASRPAIEASRTAIPVITDLPERAAVPLAADEGGWHD